MSAVVRCAHCGEEKLIEVVRETAGGTKLITCKVCSRDSLIVPENKAVCLVCGGVGSHADTCSVGIR